TAASRALDGYTVISQKPVYNACFGLRRLRHNDTAMGHGPVSPAATNEAMIGLRAGRLRPRLLRELFQVEKVPAHFLRREVVEQAQHPLEQEAVLAATELLGHDDAGMGARGRLPRLVEGSEIADVEGENRPLFGRGQGELLLVGSRIFPGFL